MPGRPVTGPEGAARSMLAVERSPVDVTCRRPPVDQILPSDGAVTTRRRLPSAATLSGCTSGPSQPGPVEQRVAGAGRFPMLDADVGD